MDGRDESHALKDVNGRIRDDEEGLDRHPVRILPEPLGELLRRNAGSDADKALGSIIQPGSEALDNLLHKPRLDDHEHDVGTLHGRQIVVRRVAPPLGKTLEYCLRNVADGHVSRPDRTRLDESPGNGAAHIAGAHYRNFHDCY